MFERAYSFITLLSMFFFLSKIVSFLFTPVFWIFGLMLWSLLANNPKRKRKILISSIIIFYFFSNSFIQDEILRIWEVPATKYSDLKKYDAGIILGGFLSYDIDFDRIQFYRGADRLFQAVELYKTGSIKRIFFVGGSGSIEFSHMKEGMFVRRYLLTLGIPDKDIWIENESRNTQENAEFAKRFLQKNFTTNGNYLLITSGLHMRRALACFKEVGIATDSYSTDRKSGPRKMGLDHLLIPSAETLWFWDGIFHEWIGMLVYKIKGYA